MRLQARRYFQQQSQDRDWSRFYNGFASIFLLLPRIQPSRAMYLNVGNEAALQRVETLNSESVLLQAPEDDSPLA
jgi:hypothetical protein